MRGPPELCAEGRCTISLIDTLRYSWNPQYTKRHHALGGKMVPPEERLKPLLIAAPFLAVAFFWRVLTLCVYFARSCG